MILAAAEKVAGPAHRLGRAVAAHRGVRRRAGRAAARPVALARGARDGRAGAVDPRAGARDRAERLAVGRARGPHRRRAAPRRADARPDDPLLRRGHRDRAAVLAPRRPARGRPRRVLRAAADLDRGHDRARRGAEPRLGLPRPGAAVDPAVRAVRDRDAARVLAGVRPEVPRRSAPSARRRCSTAWRSSTARPARRTSPGSRRRSAA